MILADSLQRKPQPHDRGAAATEFAIILPVLLALLLGILDFGFTFNTQIALTQAAREGVRVEALHFSDDDSVQRTINRTKEAFLNAFGDALTDDDISVTECPDDPDDGDRARVDVNFRYSTGLLNLGPFDLTGQAVMRCGG